VELRDWVRRYENTLDPEHHISHRMKLPGPQTSGSDAAVIEGLNPLPALGASVVGRPKVQTEQLGEEEMARIRAKGIRKTTTVPAGLQGNDRLVMIVLESWRAPDVEPPVLSITHKSFYRRCSEADAEFSRGRAGSDAIPRARRL